MPRPIDYAPFAANAYAASNRGLSQGRARI
jgi:hypothetical protein